MNDNGVWKWLSMALAGLILTLLGTVVGKTWSEHQMADRMRNLEREVEALTTMMAGDNGYGSRIADHENRLRDLEEICP